MMRIAILTISTSGARGARAEDASGDAIAAMTVAQLGATITAREIVEDDATAIAGWLGQWADGGIADVILTTGGTGFSPTDVTPEATLGTLHRLAPGLSEAMRSGTAAHTPLAWLSRGVAGLRGTTLIVNLPGSPKGVRECLAILIPLLPHAVGIQSGAIRQHPPTTT